jgi:hypothetical protein
VGEARTGVRWDPALAVDDHQPVGRQIERGEQGRAARCTLDDARDGIGQAFSAAARAFEGRLLGRRRRRRHGPSRPTGAYHALDETADDVAGVHPADRELAAAAIEHQRREDRDLAGEDGRGDADEVGALDDGLG